MYLIIRGNIWQTEVKPFYEEAFFFSFQAFSWEGLKISESNYYHLTNYQRQVHMRWFFGSVNIVSFWVFAKKSKIFVILYSSQKFRMQPLTLFWHNKSHFFLSFTVLKVWGLGRKNVRFLYSLDFENSPDWLSPRLIWLIKFFSECMDDLDVPAEMISTPYVWLNNTVLFGGNPLCIFTNYLKIYEEYKMYVIFFSSLFFHIFFSSRYLARDLEL